MAFGDTNTLLGWGVIRLTAMMGIRNEGAVFESEIRCVQLGLTHGDSLNGRLMDTVISGTFF